VLRYVLSRTTFDTSHRHYPWTILMERPITTNALLAGETPSLLHSPSARARALVARCMRTRRAHQYQSVT